MNADVGGKVISIVTVDVPASIDDEFNRWYNEEHVQEVLDCPGWIWGARYRCLDGEPKYLAVYEMESYDAMFTPELKRIKGFGRYWGHLDSYHGRTYERIYQAVSPNYPDRWGERRTP